MYSEYVSPCKLTLEAVSQYLAYIITAVTCSRGSTHLLGLQMFCALITPDTRRISRASHQTSIQKHRNLIRLLYTECFILRKSNLNATHKSIGPTLRFGMRTTRQAALGSIKFQLKKWVASDFDLLPLKCTA